MAQRIGVGGQRLDPAGDIGEGAVVDQQQCRSQAGHVADAGGNGAVGGDLVEILDGGVDVALVGLDGGGAHAREQRIGAIAILFQLIEGGDRLVVLAVIGELEGLREGIARAVGASLVPIAVASDGGGADHHKDGEAKQGRTKTVPQRLRLLATNLVVHFADKTVVRHQSKTIAAPEGDAS